MRKQWILSVLAALFILGNLAAGQSPPVSTKPTAPATAKAAAPATPKAASVKAPAAAPAEAASDGLTTLFAAGAPWRYYVRLSAPMIASAAAKAAGISEEPAARAIKITAKYDDWRGSDPVLGIATPPPPQDWTAEGFDDSQWSSQRGNFQADPFGKEYPREMSPEYGMICLRGRLMVNDPSAIGKLQLSVKYRGGVVVYLNGKEIARGSLPAGPISADTPGDDYPDQATVTERNGKTVMLNWYTDRAKVEQFALRDRSLGPVDVPAGLLKKGVNLIAVECHRSDYPLWCQKNGMNWGPIGLTELHLRGQAPEGSFVSPLIRPAGLKVWNVDVAQRAYDQDFPDPCLPLSAIKIVAARNGTFSGAVAVGSDEQIEGLTAKLGPFKNDKGAELKPDSAVMRYGQPDRRAADDRAHGVTAFTYDGLLDSPPAVVSLTGTAKGNPAARARLGLPPAQKAGAVLPVWVMVNVPKDAPPGVYRGELSIVAKGAAAVAVPVELTVIDWALPDVKDRLSLLNIYQSPDTLAMHYKVPLWSKEHWDLIDKSAKLMAEAGNDAIFIPLLSKEQVGNEESMVHWMKDGDKYKYDFAVMDKYLDVFLKHHDKARLKMIVFIAYGNSCRLGKDGKSDPTVTLVGEGGAKSDLSLPNYGTPECEALLRPLLLAVQERLKSRGLDKLMMIGMPPDTFPPMDTVAMFHNILPEVGWMRASHPDSAAMPYDPKNAKATVPILAQEHVYMSPIPDPAKKRNFGWANPRLRVSFNRPGYGPLELQGFQPPWAFRMWIETSLASGDRGAGRVGADFWFENIQLGRVSSETGGGNRGTVYQRFLKSSVGQVGLGNNTTDLLSAGHDGPVTSIRLENAREGIEAAEAVIFVEKALTEKKLAVPAELAENAWKVIDERINALRLHQLSMGSAGWQQRDRKLYELAAQLAKQPASQPAAAAAK